MMKLTHQRDATQNGFDPEKVELDSGFQRALKLVEEDRANVFLTGSAGTGKSTFVKYFMATTKLKAVVLAQTGVAALAVGGQTINSFFRYPPEFLEPRHFHRFHDTSLLQRLDVLVLDEASMISSNLMDAIDKTLRIKLDSRGLPFGGMQILLVGDLYQLPPVVEDEQAELFAREYTGIYWFDAPVFREAQMAHVELTQSYRQQDESFLRLLNAVRTGSASPEVLTSLNVNVLEYTQLTKPDEYVVLTLTNDAAERRNRDELEKLAGPEFTFRARVAGQFPKSHMPTAMLLVLKAGASVMMLSNDKDGRWVNGSLGNIARVGAKEIVVRIGGCEHRVDTYTWERIEYYYDEKADRIVRETTGTFEQYPLKLAWAITIHKSQGQSLSKVYIDLGRGAFAHGQTYVALSRCRSLEGLALAREVRDDDLILDTEALRYREILSRAGSSLPEPENAKTATQGENYEYGEPQAYPTDITYTQELPEESLDVSGSGHSAHDTKNVDPTVEEDTEPASQTRPIPRRHVPRKLLAWCSVSVLVLAALASLYYYGIIFPRTIEATDAYRFLGRRVLVRMEIERATSFAGSTYLYDSRLTANTLQNISIEIAGLNDPDLVGVSHEDVILVGPSWIHRAESSDAPQITIAVDSLSRKVQPTT